MKEQETGEEQKGTGYKLSQLGLGSVLASEGEASIRGYNTLKKLGASPNQLAKARRNLLLAGGTYAGETMALAGLNKLSYNVSKDLGKNIVISKENKKNKKEN